MRPILVRHRFEFTNLCMRRRSNFSQASPWLLEVVLPLPLLFQATSRIFVQHTNTHYSYKLATPIYAFEFELRTSMYKYIYSLNIIQPLHSPPPQSLVGPRICSLSSPRCLICARIVRGADRERGRGWRDECIANRYK